MHSLGVPIEEMYRVFNMGIGFVVIVNPKDEINAIKIIEKNLQAYKIGIVNDDPQERVTIKTFKEGIITL